MSKKALNYSIEFKDIQFEYQSNSRLRHFFPLSGTYQVFFDEMASLDHFFDVISLRKKQKKDDIICWGKSIKSISIQELQLVKQKIFFLDQSLDLQMDMTVGNFLSIPLKIQSVPDDLIQKYIREMLNWTKMGTELNRSIQKLSYEDYMLVLMMQAIISKPKLLISKNFSSVLANERLKKAIPLLRSLCAKDCLWLDLVYRPECKSSKWSWLKTYHLFDDRVAA